MATKTTPDAPLFGIEPANYSKWTHVQTPDSGVLTMEKLNAVFRMIQERSGRDTSAPRGRTQRLGILDEINFQDG